MSTYIPTIPQPGDDLSDSQPQILGNFTKANSSFGIDHYPFADATINNGKHKQVTWVDQSAAIPAAPSSQAVIAYSDTISMITMPYYKRDSVATQFPLAPIKAMAKVVSTGALGLQTVVPTTSFNITSVTRAAAGQWTFAITNPMRTASDYLVIPFVEGVPGTINFGVITASSFILNIGAVLTVGQTLNVLVLES